MLHIKHKIVFINKESFENALIQLFIFSFKFFKKGSHATLLFNCVHFPLHEKPIHTHKTPFNIASTSGKTHL